MARTPARLSAVEAAALGALAVVVVGRRRLVFPAVARRFEEAVDSAVERRLNRPDVKEALSRGIDERLAVAGMGADRG